MNRDYFDSDEILVKIGVLNALSSKIKKAGYFDDDMKNHCHAMQNKRKEKFMAFIATI